MNKKELDPYYYEKLGSKFDEYISDYDTNTRIKLITHYLQNIQSKASILEVGCGTGRISRQLSKLTDDLTVNDISEELSRIVAENLKCSHRAGHCAKLQATDRLFDIVVSSECIEHTEDPYAALSGMKRILKNGGQLIVTTPNRLWYPVLVLSQWLKIRKFQGIENWTWPLKTNEWLRSNGFEDIHFFGCHLFPWQLPFARMILPFFDRFGKQLYPFMINYGFSAIKK